MIKIKRKKDLIKGGERIICVKTKSTNEKIGKELNGEENRNRKKINPTLSVEKILKKKLFKYLFILFPFSCGRKEKEN